MFLTPPPLAQSHCLLVLLSSSFLFQRLGGKTLYTFLAVLAIVVNILCIDTTLKSYI